MPIKLKSIEIHDVGCFESLTLRFADHFNLICGANGVGKSTILAVIGGTFSYHPSDLRRRASTETSGWWELTALLGGGTITTRSEAKGLLPVDVRDWTASPLPSSLLLYFKASRDFLYQPLSVIGKDPPPEENDWHATAVSGIQQEDIKRWFANRFMFSAHANSLSQKQVADLEFAKRCFSILDDKVVFSHVDAATFDIYVVTPQGTIPYEYLSSGFRASLAMLLGIIREVEIRGLEFVAQEFDGIVLIDELDLHLHPAWQRTIVSALKRAFPKAQFITTTHSAHMIQDAELGEVIALQRDDAGNPYVHSFDPGKYGFKGWTVEEILRDVMGLEDVETSSYRETIRQFDRAVDREDAAEASRLLVELEAMLHPNNHLRKLLRLQAAPPTVDDD